jgi:hypothetical protein
MTEKKCHTWKNEETSEQMEKIMVYSIIRLNRANSENGA